MLRDEYKLAGWVSKVEDREHNYFGWCDRTLEQLSTITGGVPSDDSVVLALMAALREDDSFSAHVAKKGGTFLAEDKNWTKIYRAGGATIYHEYLVAVEKEQWPLSTD